MEKNDIPKEICRSIFKGGESTTTKSRFTKKWIELINIIEKGKSLNFTGK